MADRSREDEAVLNALVRNVQVRQGLLREAMLDDDEDLTPDAPYSFVSDGGDGPPAGDHRCARCGGGCRGMVALTAQ